MLCSSRGWTDLISVAALCHCYSDSNASRCPWWFHLAPARLVCAVLIRSYPCAFALKRGVRRVFCSFLTRGYGLNDSPVGLLAWILEHLDESRRQAAQTRWERHREDMGQIAGGLESRSDNGNDVLFWSLCSVWCFQIPD